MTGDALAEARRLLRQVLANLDDRTEACDTCGQRRAVRLPEYKAAQQLRGAVTRIEVAIGLLKGGRDVGTGPKGGHDMA